MRTVATGRAQAIRTSARSGRPISPASGNLLVAGDEPLEPLPGGVVGPLLGR